MRTITETKLDTMIACSNWIDASRKLICLNVRIRKRCENDANEIKRLCESPLCAFLRLASSHPVLQTATCSQEHPAHCSTSKKTTRLKSEFQCGCSSPRRLRAAQKMPCTLFNFETRDARDNKVPWDASAACLHHPSPLAPIKKNLHSTNHFLVRRDRGSRRLELQQTRASAQRVASRERLLWRRE